MNINNQIQSDTVEVRLSEVLPIVYDELRGLASWLMNGERAGHSLQTTELVHEAYLRLASMQEFDWLNRQHIIRMAASIMRHVLVDHARKRDAKKRDPNQLFLLCPTSQFENSIEDSPRVDLLALNDALANLRNLDERKADIIELKFFGGQTNESVSDILDISITTVKRDWALARAWMYREMNDDSFC